MKKLTTLLIMFLYLCLFLNFFQFLHDLYLVIDLSSFNSKSISKNDGYGPWPWNPKTVRNFLLINPGADPFDLLVKKPDPEYNQDPLVVKKVTDALDSNPILANCLNKGTSLEDKNNYINYALNFVDDLNGKSRLLPLTTETDDVRSRVYYNCLSRLNLSSFWSDPEYIPDLNSYLKNLKVEKELFRRIDRCKASFFLAEFLTKPTNTTTINGKEYTIAKDHFLGGATADGIKEITLKNWKEDKLDFGLEHFEKTDIEDLIDEKKGKDE